MESSYLDRIINKEKEKSDGNKIYYLSIAIVALLFVTALIVYIAPVGIEKLFIIILLFIFWYSKSDYFWFAFFIVISSFPAGFFTETESASIRRLPIYSIIPKMSFTVMDLFLIIAFIKAMVRGKRIDLIDVFNIKKITYILPFVVITSFFFGITLKLFLNQTVRGLFFYTLFYSLPALLNNKKEIHNFMLMFLPFVFIEVLAQLYFINTGTSFATIFHSGGATVVYSSLSEDIRAIPSGYIVMRIAYVFAFVLLESKDVIVSRIYLLSVIIMSVFSVIISATRSAIVMLIFIFIMYFIVISKKKPNVIVQIFITVVILVMLLDAANVFNLNSVFGFSYTRFVGAVNIEEGSIKSADSFEYRITNRLPRLLDAIKSSFFIGYGFSDKYFEYYDGHLGGVLIGILQVGVFGYLIFLVFISNIFKRCFFYIRKLSDENHYKNIIKVFTLSFFGYMIVNLTVDPIFVLNATSVPQDIFVHLVVATFFINLAIREHMAMKKAKLYEITDRVYP